MCLERSLSVSGGDGGGVVRECRKQAKLGEGAGTSRLFLVCWGAGL